MDAGSANDPQTRLKDAARSLDNLRDVMVEASELLRKSNAPDRAFQLCHESAQSCRSVAIEMRDISRAISPKPRRMLARAGIGIANLAIFVASSAASGGIGAIVGHELEQRILVEARGVESACEQLLVNSESDDELHEAMRLAEQARQSMLHHGLVVRAGSSSEATAALGRLDRQLQALDGDVSNRLTHATGGSSDWFLGDPERIVSRLEAIIEVLNLAIYPESEEMQG